MWSRICEAKQALLQQKTIKRDCNLLKLFQYSCCYHLDTKKQLLTTKNKYIKNHKHNDSIAIFLPSLSSSFLLRLRSLGKILIGLYLQRLRNVCLRKSFRILAPFRQLGHQGLSGLSPSLALSSFASLISSSSLLIPVFSLSFSFFLSDFSDFFDFFDDFSGDFDRDFDLDRWRRRWGDRERERDLEWRRWGERLRLLCPRLRWGEALGETKKQFYII